MGNTNNAGYYLDDYQFSYVGNEPATKTLIISVLENAKIVSFYTDKNGQLHAIVKEQPYLKYRPINITVKVQDLSHTQDRYYTKLNEDFVQDDILYEVKKDWCPVAYIYKDMSCKYWQDQKNIEEIKKLI